MATLPTAIAIAWIANLIGAILVFDRTYVSVARAPAIPVVDLLDWYPICGWRILAAQAGGSRIFGPCSGVSMVEHLHGSVLPCLRASEPSFAAVVPALRSSATGPVNVWRPHEMVLGLSSIISAASPATER